MFSANKKDWLFYFQTYLQSTLWKDKQEDNKLLHFIQPVASLTTPDEVMKEINKQYPTLKLDKFNQILPKNADSSSLSVAEYLRESKTPEVEKLFINCIYYKRRIDQAVLEEDQKPMPASPALK